MIDDCERVGKTVIYVCTPLFIRETLLLAPTKSKILQLSRGLGSTQNQSHKPLLTIPTRTWKSLRMELGLDLQANLRLPQIRRAAYVRWKNAVGLNLKN